MASLDASLHRLLHGAGGPALVAAGRALSAAGEHGACWLALGAAGALGDPARAPAWRRGAAGVAAVYALNTAIKQVVRRRRPDVAGLPALAGTPTRLSFPSAHASTSFAAARAYSALVPAAPLYALATLMALTRLQLGVHHASDVVAGAALGTLAGSLAR